MVSVHTTLIRLGICRGPFLSQTNVNIKSNDPDVLIEAGAIKFIDPMEQECALIAPNSESRPRKSEARERGGRDSQLKQGEEERERENMIVIRLMDRWARIRLLLSQTKPFHGFSIFQWKEQQSICREDNTHLSLHFSVTLQLTQKCR